MFTETTSVFRVETMTAGSMSIVAPQGEVDISAQQSLKDEIERALAGRPVVLAIDLRGVSFMDSSGIHALITTSLRCQELGLRFFVIRGGPHIDRLLSACGIEGCFEMVAGPDQLTGSELAT